VNPPWCRRARVVLGTLVEIGLPEGQAPHLSALWAVLDTVQSQMSAHVPDSDIARLNAAPVGQRVPLHPWSDTVLQLAQGWQRDCAAFDVACGTGRWALQGGHAWRQDATTRIDLGGLAKGWAVDQVVAKALALGIEAVWVNAGGDLRTHGVAVPLQLRDEGQGGTRPFGTLSEGAFATSDFRPAARSRLWVAPSAQGRAQANATATAAAAATPPGRHVSVLADTCTAADALTKVVAALGLGHPQTQGLLQAHGAQAWVHDGAP